MRRYQGFRLPQYLQTFFHRRRSARGLEQFLRLRVAMDSACAAQSAQIPGSTVIRRHLINQAYIRAFLDAVATSVVELDETQQQVNHYTGGWSDYRAAKALASTSTAMSVRTGASSCFPLREAGSIKASSRSR